METTTRGAVRHPSTDLSYEERDACLHALGALHAAGKLSLTELEARIEAAFAAATDAELWALVRESSRVEVAPQRPTQTEAPPVVAPAPRRPGRVLFSVRVVGFFALTLLVGVAKVLALAAVAVIVGVLGALVLIARGGRYACTALVRQAMTWAPTVGREQARPVPVRLQLRRAPSKELVLAPRAQVPAQRQPAKIHPVIVPTQRDSSTTDLVSASRSTHVVATGSGGVRRVVLARDLGSADVARPREERRVRELVSQLRPLVHRVTDRATWRRMTTSACERAARTKGWRGSVGDSRTVF